jgi:cell cycle sensor histidine kinase DivJ
VAHELRTPLNSIIPIIKMIIDFYQMHLDPRLMSYMKIILNSSLHLQNLIEDALDMCRIENNKFTVAIENFNIREVIKEVTDIM